MADITYGTLGTYGDLGTYAMTSTSSDSGTSSCPWTSSLITTLQNSIAELKSLIQALQSDVTAIKAKTDNLPSNTATTLAGLSTFDPGTTSVNVSSDSISSIKSGLATSANITTLQDHGDSNWTGSGGATASAIASAVWSYNYTNSDGSYPIPANYVIRACSEYNSTTDSEQLIKLSDIKSYGDNHWSTANASTIAAGVWGYTASSGRTLTGSVDVSSDSISSIRSGLATSSGLSSLATASSIQTLQSSVNAIPTTTYTIPTDYAKSSEITALQTHGDAEWVCTSSGSGTDSGSSGTYTGPTASAIATAVWTNTTRTLTSVAGLGVAQESTLTDLIGSNTCNGSVLGISDSEGNTSVSLTVTKDANGLITSIK